MSFTLLANGNRNTCAGPILILNGECDTFQRKGEAAFLAAAQHVQLHIIQGANRIRVLARTQEVTDTIRTFVVTLHHPSDEAEMIS